MVQRTYRTEEARLCVQELQSGWGWGGGWLRCRSGLRRVLGLMGVFLYSVDAVREAWTMPSKWRAPRIEWAEAQTNTILAQLSDGVIAVDKASAFKPLNPPWPTGWG